MEAAETGKESAAFAQNRRFAAALRFWLSEEEAYGGRFLFLPFFLAIGIIAYFALPFEPAWSLLAALCAAVALLWGLAWLRGERAGRSARLFCSFVFAACLGSLCAKAETESRATIMLENTGFTHITARILAIEEQDSGGFRLVLELLGTQSPVLARAPQHLRLSARSLPAGAELGAGLKGLALLRNFSGPLRPNSYDFAFQGYFRGIGGQGSFAGVPQLAALPPPESMAERAGLKLGALRALMTKRIKAAVGGEPGAVAAALITGERGGIAPETSQNLRLAGLAHILSISGLHMAMAAGMVLLVCRKFFGLFPVLSSRFSPKKPAAAIALAASAFYLALSGADVSAERSFIMVAVMLLAVLCGRAAISLRNLAISACVIMVLRPHEIMGPSFQMSFAATAALISAFAAWTAYQTARRERAEQKAEESGRPLPRFKPQGKMQMRLRTHIFRPVLSTCMASLVAGAAGGLYSAYHFNNTAPYGLLGNVLALPLMSLIVMPAALLGTVLMPLHCELLPFLLMRLGIIGVEKAAAFVASLSPPGNLGAISPAALLLLTAGLALLLFLRTPLRLVSLAFFAAGIALYICAPLPLALIAENGMAAGVFQADNRLALSTARADSFMARNWQTGFAAEAGLPPARGRVEEGAAEAAEPGGRFVCAEDLCEARLRNGSGLALAQSKAALLRALGRSKQGAILVLNALSNAAEEAELRRLAQERGAELITQRDLALFGAAAITPSAGGVQWAVPNPRRPWNSYRRYGKAAQGMPS